MPALSHAVVFTGYLSGATGPVAVGTALLYDADGDRLIIATDANRTATGRKTACVAIEAGDDDNVAILCQFAGPVDSSVTSLGAGSATTIYVNSSGVLARGGTPGIDDIVGRCDADGTAYLLCGGVAGAAGGASVTVPGGSDAELQYRASSTTFGAVPWNYRGSGEVRADDNSKQTVLNDGTVKNVWIHEGGADSFLSFGVTGAGEEAASLTHDYVGVGAQKQLSLNVFNEANGTEASFVVAGSLSSGGLAPNGGILCLPNMTVGSSFNFTGSFGGGIGVFCVQKATTNPSTPYTHGSIVYSNASSSNDLFYLRSDGVVVPMGAAFTNVGGEAEVYKSTSGITHSLRTIKAGSNVTVTQNANDITIAASGGGGSISGTDTYVVFFDGTDNPAGDAGMTYDKTNDVVTLAGAIAQGSAPATTGAFRATAPAAATTHLIRFRQAGSDYDAYQVDTAGGVQIIGNTGTHASVMRGYTVDVSTGAGTNWTVTCNGTQALQATNAAIKASLPILGDSATSSPWSVHGNTSVDIGNADYSVSTTVNQYGFITFTSGTVMTADRTVTFPAPAAGQMYWKLVFIDNTSLNMHDIIFSIGSGRTVETVGGTFPELVLLCITSSGIRSIPSL